MGGNKKHYGNGDERNTPVCFNTCALISLDMVLRSDHSLLGSEERRVDTSPLLQDVPGGDVQAFLDGGGQQEAVADVEGSLQGRVCDMVARGGSERVGQVGEDARDDEREESEEWTSEAPSFQRASSKDAMVYPHAVPGKMQCLMQRMSLGCATREPQHRTVPGPGESSGISVSR